MFENLSERLERSFKILKGEGKITEINVAETLKDVRRALLDADVNYKVAKSFTDTVKQKALGQDVLTAVKPQQLMVKIVHDELAELMGGETTDMNLKGHPAIILMAGLNGAGKTTMSGKLAKLLHEKRGKNPLLAACDTFRPAAMEQLRVLGEQVGVPVYIEEGATDPVLVARNAIQYAKAKGHDVLIIDTAGRQAIDEELMQQIQDIRDAVQPDEILFVVEVLFSPSSMAIPEVVLRSASEASSTNPSSSSAQARRWKHSTPSTQAEWPTASSEWATSSRSSREHRNSTMKRKHVGWNAKSRRTSSTSTTSWDRYSKSRRWAASRTWPA